MWSGRSALHEGDLARDAGDLEGAITWWRRAARWYLPGAPHVDGAYERLEEIARGAEENGEVELALLAWRGVRSSALATRGLWTPHSDRLAVANQELAKLMVEIESPQLAGGQSGETRRDWHHDRLARDRAPSVGWTVLAILGFALWVGAAVYFAMRGVSEEDHLRPRPALHSGLLVAVGLILWMFGLYFA